MRIKGVIIPYKKTRVTQLDAFVDYSKCTKCNGSGKYAHTVNGKLTLIKCPICFGTGKPKGE